MKIHERNQVKAIRELQCHEGTKRVWQYYSKDENPCGCGSNCYHFEYDRTTEEIYGVCNCCNKEVYTIKEEYKDNKLKQGEWLNNDWRF